MNLTSLNTLLDHELQDIYDAENRIAAALPKLANAAHNPELKEALNQHLEETRGQIERLNRVFAEVGSQGNGETCEAARGLIEEGEQIINASGNPAVKDAALIGAAQRVEHYEMAAYGTACALAKELELDQVASLLHESLAEEKAADKKLTKLAEGGLMSSGLNKEAQQAMSV